MTIEYKFFAKNNKSNELKALETLKENIENKRKDSTAAIKSTILPIRNMFGVTSFSIVLKCKGDFEHCGYSARMNNPERITNLLRRLSEKTRVNYEAFTTETSYNKMTRRESFTRNGISYKIYIKLEPVASPSLVFQKTRIKIYVTARVSAGISIKDTYEDFYKLENVPESYIRSSVEDAIGRVTNGLKAIEKATNYTFKK